MKSYDYNAVIYNADVYCTRCLPVQVRRVWYGEAESWPGVYPIFASNEWDYYPSCSVCGEVHDYVGLTTYGQEYEESCR